MRVGTAGASDLYSYIFIICLSAFFITEVRAEQPGVATSHDIDVRARFVIDNSGPSNIVTKAAKFLGYDILGATAKEGCRDGEWSESMSKIIDVPVADFGDADDPDIFALVALTRFVFAYNKCLDDTQIAHIKDMLARRQHLLSHGTINHAILRASSNYLLAQLFPDVVWADQSGKQFTAPQLRASLKDLMLKSIRGFFEQGQVELFSPTYVMANFAPLLNLIDFADDDQLRKAAENAAIAQLAALRANSFHGVILPPYQRLNFQQRNAAASAAGSSQSVGQHVLWFYYGEPALTAQDLQSRREPNYAIMLAVSKWRPPRELLALPPHEPYEIATTLPKFSLWGARSSPMMTGSSLVDPDFAIGAGNAIVDPAEYNYGGQTFGIYFKAPGDVYNYVECYQPYWHSNTGDGSWDPDRSSPFEEVVRVGAAGVLLFDIPESDPWRYGAENRFYMVRNNNAEHLLQEQLCRFPTTVDEQIVDGNAIFIRKGNVMAALVSQNGDFEARSSTSPRAQGFALFAIQAAKNAIYYEVGKTAEFGNLEKFRAAVTARKLSYNAGEDLFSFTTPAGKRVDAHFSLTEGSDGKSVASVPNVSVGGHPFVADASTYAVKAKFMSLGKGRLAIDSPGGKLSLGAP